MRISRIPHSQSSGIAREACALKGERCVFYELDINLEVFNLETDFFGDLHCSSRFTDMLCDAQTQYGDYSELDECPMWGMWEKKGEDEMLDDMDFDKYGKVKCSKIEQMLPKLMKMGRGRWSRWYSNIPKQ